MNKILANLKSTADLKNLNLAQLKYLAQEIRHKIISVVSDTGGHLASSLGTVELAIALHYALDTPKDKVIWDVGHQAYAHKLLTGRYDTFHTLRQTDGISGFLKPHESEYDAFAAGHASTSIAAALGIASARDLAGENFKVVPVIGDGSMTCGLVYEALNTTTSIGTNFMMILNDNEMSISKNVGAIAQIFNRIITDDRYNYAKERLEGLIKRLRTGTREIGSEIIRFSHKIEGGVKGLIVPGIFFEELGFRYFGPIDGHDFEALIPAIRKAARFKVPRILHIVTKKGKGYTFAEKNPEFFHSASAFHIKTGIRKTPVKLSFTEVFGDTLFKLAEKNKKIVAISAAMPSGTGLKNFAKQFPDRFFDFGIAESAAVTTAAGMASEGLRPVVAIYSTFLQRAYDMIIHDVAMQELPVVFALDRAGLVGADGPTHHGTFDLSYLRMIPGMVIIAPRNEEELMDSMATALSYKAGPVAVRYPRGGSGEENLNLERDAEPFNIGEGSWLRKGGKVAIIGVGTMTNHAMEAARILEKEGINIGVADARFVKPLDENLLLEAVENYDYVFTIEDNVIAGGFGSGVNEYLASKGKGKFVSIIGLPDKFIEHGSPSDLYEKYGFSPEQIANKIRKCLES
jgi:1-deoxy-D-xylulose-5-phosphate synthase